MVNGRPYFKKGNRGIWWNGDCSWNIGYDSEKGSNNCTAYFVINVMSPLEINQFNGMLLDGEKKWIDAGKLLAFKRSMRGKYTEKILIKILLQHFH